MSAVAAISALSPEHALWRQALANPKVVHLAQAMNLDLADPAVRQHLVQHAMAVQPSCAVLLNEALEQAPPVQNYRVAKALKAYAEVAEMA